jgi:hypothetical protein
MVLAIGGGCRVHTTPDLQAVCTGANVAQRLVLSVDSLTSRAGPDLRALAGKKYHVAVTLLGRISTADCPDRSGDATFEGELPSALASAVASRGRATPHWLVQGVNVLVELNPGVLDNAITITLPLDGSPGRWGLSTLAGEVVSGRAVREQ